MTINSAYLTSHSLVVQNHDGSVRRHICNWPSENRSVDPATLMADADTQLRLAGYRRNFGWAYLPIRADGMWVSIRPINLS